MRANLIVLVLAIATPAWAEPPVVAVPWPTRSVDPVAHRQHVFEVAGLVARRLRAEPPGEPREGLVDLTGALARAQSSFLAGRLDEAASAFDAALAQAARAPHQLADGAAFITAHVTRTSIALARGERDQARQLMERALRFDPGLMLSIAEESPGLQAALRESRERLGQSPALRRADLGQLCDRSALLVVGRRLRADAIEWSRWEGCRAVTTLVLPSGARAEEIAALLAVPRAGAGSSDARPRQWPAPALAAFGAVITTGGIVLTALAARKFGELQRSCGVDSSCPSAQTDAWDSREKAGWVLLSIGVTALVAGGLWALWQRWRGREARSALLRAALGRVSF